MSKIDHDRDVLRLIDERKREAASDRRDAKENVAERPRAIFWGKISDDLVEELDGFDFDYLCEMFSALQHAFVYGDLHGIMRTAADDKILGNYTLRLVNKMMIGRQFLVQKGKVVIRREGKLEWDASQIVAVYRAMIAALDAECDELPKIHPDFQALVASHSSEPV